MSAPRSMTSGTPEAVVFNVAVAAFHAGWVASEGELDRDSAFDEWWDTYAEEIQTAAREAAE